MADVVGAMACGSVFFFFGFGFINYHFLHPVVLVKFKIVNELYQSVCITWIGGITRLMQTFRPSFVICFSQLKKKSIPPFCFQKTGMIIERLFRFIVFAETFIFLIIVLYICFSFPVISMAFYSKVVVGIHRERTVTGIRFQQSLCERNAGGNSVLKHFFYCNILVFVHIFCPGEFILCWLGKAVGNRQ